jgi:exonuclease SbcC
MRPVRLVAEGFTAFRDRVEIDFTDVDFFALVGPTGSGKSSVIDAMCFALYGCVPRYENKSIVAPAITVGALQATVSLEFSVANSRYLATRVVRRQKVGASTKEARLERIVGETTTVLAGNPDEMSARVEELLGLSFEYFTRCVVLPQGEFARFLHDKPSERQQLLRGLLNIDVYARVGERARKRGAADRAKAELTGRQLAGLSAATPEALAEAEERVERLANLDVALRQAEPALDELSGELEAAGRAVEEAHRRGDALGRIAMPVAIEVMAAEEAQLRAALQQAKAALVSRQDSLRATTAAASEAGAGRVPELEVAARNHVELALLLVRLAEASEAASAAVRSDDDAQAALRTAESAAEAARGALEEAQREHSAAHLAAGLAVGDTCPVCQQSVIALPTHAGSAAVDDARAAVARAEATLQEARSSAAKTAAARATADATQAALAERLEAARRSLLAYPEADVVAELLTQARQARARLGEAQAALEAGRAELAEAEAKAQAGADRLRDAWREFDRQRDTVAGLGPPAASRSDLREDWSALVAWAKDELVAQLAAEREATAACEGFAEARGEAIARLGALCVAAGVEITAASGLGDLRAEAARTLEAARSAAKTIAGDIARAAELALVEREQTARAEVAEALGQHLRSTGFERWLVSEALDLLVVGASATLRELSGGQYSLAHDEKNDFVVVDHRNADERRAARTLSGGETFQASLALALALAEQLSGLAGAGASRIESIFLDEGFGTLDPDALAVVADTIEALGSGERMVGIVTHVRELAERVPVRYEVSKNARTSLVEPRQA